MFTIKISEIIFQVVEAAVEALRSHGAGVSSVRFICGTQDIHKQLESKISEFHGREDSILYPSCFDANAGLFEQICGPEVRKSVIVCFVIILVLGRNTLR